MAVVIDGTNGITTPVETISGTGVWSVGGTQIYKDTSGNVGIGMNSPGYKLDVTSSSNAIGAHFYTPSGQSGIRIETAGNDKAVVEQYTNGNGNWRIGPGITVAGAYEFNSVTAGATRMLIDSSGNLLVGTTSTPNASTPGQGILKGATGTYIYNSCSVTSAYGHYTFWNPNGAVGSISTNGSATAYNTSSDQRLKKNIIDASGALSSVNAIKVRSFDWKADGSHVDYGYIAQELLEVVPEAVSVPANPEEMMGVDFGRLTPRLVKSIQELSSKLDDQQSLILDLQTEINQLKGAK